MSGHTPGTLSTSADGFELRVEGGSARYRFPTWIAQVYDTMIDTDEALANAKRLAACWNALKDCDTERLIELTERGLTLELALQGSLLLDNAREAERVEKEILQERLRDAAGTETTEQDDAEAFRGTRGD